MISIYGSVLLYLTLAGIAILASLTGMLLDYPEKQTGQGDLKAQRRSQLADSVRFLAGRVLICLEMVFGVFLGLRFRVS